MKTVVVNVKDEYDVYIGRGKGGIVNENMNEYGDLGNPVKFGESCPVCKDVHFEGDRVGLIRCYKKWFWGKINEDVEFRKRILELEGKRLGCFCSPKPCHGDVIVAWLKKKPLKGE